MAELLSFVAFVVGAFGQESRLLRNGGGDLIGPSRPHLQASVHLPSIGCRSGKARPGEELQDTLSHSPTLAHSHTTNK